MEIKSEAGFEALRQAVVVQAVEDYVNVWFGSAPVYEPATHLDKHRADLKEFFEYDAEMFIEADYERLLLMAKIQALEERIEIFQKYLNGKNSEDHSLCISARVKGEKKRYRYFLEPKIASRIHKAMLKTVSSMKREKANLEKELKNHERRRNDY